MIYFDHVNLNVINLEKSIAFYQEALDLAVSRERRAADGSFILTFLSDANQQTFLELTWLRDRKEPYNLGDNETHIAFRVEDFEAAYARHKAMDCICHENLGMGVYFISDPDGYWLEIVPKK